MDAIPFLFESPDLADEGPSGDPNAKPGDYGNLIHLLTQNLPETYDMVAQWRAVVDEKKAEDNITRYSININIHHVPISIHHTFLECLDLC